MAKSPRCALAALLLVLLIASQGRQALGKMLGMSYGAVFGVATVDEFASLRSGQSLFKLKQTATNYVGITIYGEQESRTATEIKTSTDFDNVRYVIEHCKVLGMKVMLKPILEICCPRRWRGFIPPSKPWFAEYGRWISELAEFAEREGVDLFAIGGEFITADKDTQGWRNVTRMVRAKYKGKITYVANHDAFRPVKFWDDLDFISISGYHRLLPNDLQGKSTRTVQQTIQLWRNYIDDFNTWRIRNGYGNLKVIIGEAGYQSKGNGVGWREPFHWNAVGPPDQDQQNTLTEALLAAWLPLDWVEGLYIWFWDSNPDTGKEGLSASDYTPQNKKAEETITRYFKAFS